MSGITASHFIALPIPTSVLIAAVWLTFCCIVKEALRAYLPLFLTLSFFIGIGFTLSKYQFQRLTSFYTLLASHKDITLHGHITNIEKLHHPHFSCRITLDVVAITFDDKATKHNNYTLFLYCKNFPNDLLVADTVNVTGIHVKTIENSSFSTYLAKEKIQGTFFIENCNVIHRISRPYFSLYRMLFFFREKIHTQIAKKMEKQTFSLFSSIFLGNKTSVKPQLEEQKDIFKIWGISHHLARSGLHLVIFALCWLLILSLLPLSLNVRQLLFILIAGVYACLSWSSVSFERALLMLCIYKLAVILKKPMHYIHLLTLVTLIILLWNPLHLFFLDFQLSFGLTGALAWFNTIESHKKSATHRNIL